jgi:phosphoribosylamine---glycine ligase
MNILIVSRSLVGGDLAQRMKKEGHGVKLFIEDDFQKQNLEGIVEKTDDWKKELSWIGKDGLIIFDDSGYGEIQDELRKKGYSVVGGSAGGDKLEDLKHYSQKIFSVCGINVAPSAHFNCASDAIKFIEKNRGLWVIKQNGHASKSFNYVGQLESGEDVIGVLKSYNRNNEKDCHSIELQKRILGVEIGVGRYFNGNDWTGPIEINLEHKNLCDGNLGPKTDEMGTLMWYDDNEDNKIFTETLGKLKPYLQKIDFRGDVDINCIINEEGINPLEATARFGWPAVQLQSEIHISPWGEFLKAVADGKSYNLKYKKGYGIVVLVATPPFPYGFNSKEYCSEGIKIIFKKEMTPEDMDHIHFEEVSIKNEEGDREYYISSKTGFILHVTGMGKTAEEAKKNVYSLAENIIIPKMFYRTDIGLEFIDKDQKNLKKWGWI